METVLVSPLHDPNAQLLGEIEENGKKLVEIFNDLLFVSMTRDTSPKIFDVLQKINLSYSLLPQNLDNNLGNNYRNAIRLGLENDQSHILLMDFDRSLHWVRSFPEELAKIKKELANLNGFTSFVRTQRAFETHPLTQRSTETTVNSIASEFAGTQVDIMSGAFGMDKTLAELILANSNRNDYGFYAEPLKIAVENKININTLQVEGLEWETPDQYKKRIEQEGYTKWLNDFQSLSEWEKRVKLVERSTEVLTEDK